MEWLSLFTLFSVVKIRIDFEVHVWHPLIIVTDVGYPKARSFCQIRANAISAVWIRMDTNIVLRHSLDVEKYMDF